ncbi:hypothetical protein [uncultured Brevibacillus sp.]|uniref:hypothetical protein n=1 Tax=uncultured Brevibacillus sp. TaxID=169970 RepID=UPI0025934115|nr:hypothetical protein [uncultured Brevibacillus sp.]
MSLELPISHQDNLKCKNCNSTFNHTFIIGNLEYESNDERGMGEEIQYSFTEEVTCPSCNHKGEVIGEVWEYPVGTVNLIQLT